MAEGTLEYYFDEVKTKVHNFLLVGIPQHIVEILEPMITNFKVRVPLLQRIYFPERNTLAVHLQFDMSKIEVVGPIQADMGKGFG